MAPSEPGVIDLTVNYPPPDPDEERAPDLAKTLEQLSRRRDLGTLLRYPPEGGAAHHRAAGAAWIRRGGLDADPDDVIVSSGGQHGMTAVFGGMLRPGDTIATEALTYPGLKALANLMHLRLTGVAMDAGGMLPEAFAAACKAGGGSIKALYTVPTLHNPTSAVLSEERRRALAAIAREHEVLIVEDDVHGRLIEGGPRPLAALAPERSVYLTGIAKTVAPGLRVGFVHAARPILPRIARAIRATTWMAAPLMAEIAAQWIDNGIAEEWLRRHRAEAAARQKIAARVFRGLRADSHPASYYTWLHLSDGWRAETFTAAARRLGIGVIPASVFQVGRGGGEAVRICLGPAKDHEELQTALAALADLASHGEPSLSFAPGP